MRASLLLSVLRPAGPVAVGISLGFTLSLLSVTWVEEPCGPGPPQPGDSELPPRGNTNAARRPNSVQPGAERERPGAGAGESWEPRVLPYHPAQPGQAAKKAVRYCSVRPAPTPQAPEAPAGTRALGTPPEAGSSSGRRGPAGQEVLGPRLLLSCLPERRLASLKLFQDPVWDPAKPAPPDSFPQNPLSP